MKIAVLISGGVDSAVAVHKLVEEGHDLHLFYIRIGMDDGRGDCSAEEDIEMCRLTARRYGLPLEIVSLHEEYWEHVMQYALRNVREGFTPNPDVMCNKIIKFGYFEERWGHEFDLTATGHYATTHIIDGKKYLGTGVDPVKDQTDFLARIDYSQLSHLIFPIGDMPKAQVRETAIATGLPNALRRDSQGICFLGKINYNDFLRRHLGEKPGPIIELETGRKLGTHRGFWFHTIGQRKGLGLSGGPWYVVRKNVHDNVIYVSCGFDTEKQYGHSLHLEHMHWITEDPWPGECDSVEIRFKNRHSPEFLHGKLSRIDTNRYMIESVEKVQGIAPGQFAVIYNPQAKLCLGSGMITADPDSEPQTPIISIP
ncbi:MAG: tRNA 2-thiouridine(34) synthase MnmA [Muribaculaceae bacterium]|nr:tRNA 2-thiouridine(34) synthase MnmA [Muribaculaceae bacterium]